MITIKTLESISIQELLHVFNLSFSDYIVPFRLNREQLEDKIKSESIQLELSVGAFEDNQLIAFVLHGYDFINGMKVMYNAGTGVIPIKRGNKLTVKLYEYILPILYNKQIHKIQLEVITTNIPAIKAYQHIGFNVIRKFNCYKGEMTISEINNSLEVKEFYSYDWSMLQSFWDFKPSWQNSITAIEKLRPSNISIGIYQSGRLLGYLVYNPKIKRVQQISVDKTYRRKGVGKQLLNYVYENYENTVSVINVDDSSEETVKFITNTGMKIFAMQYEMELVLNK